ncbi:MAG TPA: hypothetical protein VEI02_12085 [Planctomycetota bacterium]|nr:hypothetical protein [Planctomycetota bacterium]
MIWILVAALTLLSGVARAALGAAGAAVPWGSLAWTVVAARRGRLGRFAGVALLGGAIEGVSIAAPWAAVPFACLVAGWLAVLTRRLLPVRRLRGEATLGALFAAPAAALIDRFRAASPETWGSAATALPAAVGLLLTGATVAGLAALADRSPRLRAALGRL